MSTLTLSVEQFRRDLRRRTDLALTPTARRGTITGPTTRREIR